MARKSYGGDMFSPLRDDLSSSYFFKSSESDCSMELSKVSCDADKEELAKTNENFTRRADESRKNAINEKEVIKTNDMLFESSSANSLTSEDMHHNRISYITTRNKKSYLSENDVSRAKDTSSDLNKSLKKSKRNKKNNLMKHITLRSESSNMYSNSKIKQRDSFSSSLFSLAEEKFEKEPFCSETVGSSKKNAELPSDPLKEKVESTSNIKTGINKGHSHRITCKSNSGKQDKSMVNTKIKSVVDREVQTDGISQINSSAGIMKKCFTCQQISIGVNVSNPQSQIQQIQANIIEKVVKDTVSFEFEDVRQLILMMQLSLYKRLDRISEEQHSSDNAILLKVIEELVEENRRLKRFINASRET